MPRTNHQRELRALIEAAGLSQQQAARVVGIDPRTMRRYLSESASATEPPALVMAGIRATLAPLARRRT